MALGFVSRTLLVLSVTPVLLAVACSAAPPSDEELDAVELPLPNCPQPNAGVGGAGIPCPIPRDPDPRRPPPPPPPPPPAWSQNSCGSGKYLVTTTTGTCPDVGNNGFAKWDGTPLFAGVASGKCSYRWKKNNWWTPSVGTPNWAALEAIALKTPYVETPNASQCNRGPKPVIFSQCTDLPDESDFVSRSVTIHKDAKPRSIAPGCMYGEMVGCGSCAVAMNDHVYVTLDPNFAQRGDLAIGLGSPDTWVLVPHAPGDQVFQVALPASNTLPENTPLVVGLYIPGSP